MDSNKVRLGLRKALDELLKHDSYLLRADANERSISHCLAVYLKAQFPDWSVDCEYNRNHHDVKRLELEPRDTGDDDVEAVTVFPDIIVHRRSTDENLLVVEIKKSTSRQSADYDIRKLTAFKTQLQYGHAAFVRLKTGSAVASVEEIRFLA